MDHGHYNCRDYANFAPATSIPSTTSTATIAAAFLPVSRHESFQELEDRSRSPASRKPRFPLMRLPTELRIQILGYLLPHTQEYRDSGLMAEHARNFGAVKKRAAKGMDVPPPPPSVTKAGRHHSTAAGAGGIDRSMYDTVWRRGNVSVLRACRQLHREGAEMMYGRNTFLLFVTYSNISFRFRWVLPSGLAPTTSRPFLETVSGRYLHLVKKAVVHIDHVDSYTGMIKFNVGGRGLAVGVRKQVQRLVDALRRNGPEEEEEEESSCTEEDVGGDGGSQRCLESLRVRVSNGNAVLDSLKSDHVRKCEGNARVNEELQTILAPLGHLRGVRNVSISGAIPPNFARQLESEMKSSVLLDDAAAVTKERMDDPDPAPVHLCVYGNDL